MTAPPRIPLDLPPVPATFLYNATVLRVIDVDTLLVDVDWGWRRHDTDVPVRLYGVAGRELSEPGGREASEHVAGLLPAGTAVVLVTAKPDKYAPRWLARVVYQRDGRPADLGADLIADAWVVAWNGRGAQPKPPWPRKATTP